MPANGHAPEEEARAFAVAFESFLDWVHSTTATDDRNEVAALVADFLGADGAEQSVVSRLLPVFDQVIVPCPPDCVKVWLKATPAVPVLTPGLVTVMVGQVIVNV